MNAAPRYCLTGYPAYKMQIAWGFLTFEVGFLIHKTILPDEPWLPGQAYWYYR